MSRQAAPGRRPEIILHNAHILTLEDALPQAQAIGIRAGRICALGSDDQVLALADDACEYLDLEGRTVVPGLIDGHAHLDREGLKGIYPSLGTVESIADIQEKIAALARQTPRGEWIVVMPLGTPPLFDDMPQALREGRFPDRHDLDAAAPDHPVYIRSIWGFWRHTTPLVSIANTRALECAGINEQTPSPSPQVIIERDAQGIPTGVFRENTLMPIVELVFFREVTRFSVAARVKSMSRSTAAYHAFGTTSVHEGHGAASELVRAYQKTHAAGQLDMRIQLAWSPNWRSVPVEDIAGFMEAWCGWLADTGQGDEYFRIAGMFVDMGPDPDNRLRAQAYPDTGWAGFNYDTARERDQVLAVLRACARLRIQVIAIWPNMLGLFHQIHQETSLKGLRWVLGHVSTLSPQAVEQIREMGLIVTTHTNRYLYKEGPLLCERLPAERHGEIVPLRTLTDAGIPVVLATDNVPVSLFHPMWHAVARKARANGMLISPEQALSREEALRCMTRNGSLLTWQEAEKGSLKVGKMADLAVLSANPLQCPEAQIPEIRAVMTMVGGRIVHHGWPS
ncbi:MAG: amidohydrolase [Castellaniella sp.]